MSIHDTGGLDGARVLDHVRGLEGEIVDLLQKMVLAESPTDVPDAQRENQRLITEALRALDFDVRMIPGRRTGGHLYARPSRRERGRPAQLLIGHCDTVWPLGTLRNMPLRLEDGRLYGPGVFDMKGGLVQILFALRTLRELGMEPTVTPVVFVNSDEESGSPESGRWVGRVARSVCRALVLEPAMGAEGKLKTARKGVGTFTVTVEGKAAHAGLDPDGGASAIVELAHVIQQVHDLNDRERGRSVNVGVIDGGLRPNVIAPEAQATIDVRVLTMEDGRVVSEALRGLVPTTPGVRLRIEGGTGVPPMERTPRNLALWETTRRLGEEMGLQLKDTTAGGGSDGNTTSQYTATLDGLGPVGDGAHAVHEHVEIEGLIVRCALLARLIMAPPNQSG